MDYRKHQRLLQGAPHNEFPAIAAETGLPVASLLQIKYGRVKNPRVDTLEKIAAYFDSRSPPVTS